ncbi:hypothetical protein KR009_003054, partial [Drosophila setifemur]
PSSREKGGQNGSVDRKVSTSSSANIPKMELLKVNYVHQCKQAIMRRSNESQFAPRLKTPPRFGGYARHPLQMSNLTRITSPSCLAGSSPASKGPKKPLTSLPPPTVESWQLLLHTAQKRSSLPRLMHREPSPMNRIKDVNDAPLNNDSQSSCSCDDSSSDTTSTVIVDTKKSQSWKCHRDFLRDAGGIKSRADRIARIENTECPIRSLPQSRIPNPVTQPAQQETAHTRQPVPKWMFHKAGVPSGSSNSTAPLAPNQSPRFQNKPKLERVHIRKKRQPLLTINRLSDEKEWFDTQDQATQQDHRTKGCEYNLRSKRESDRNTSVVCEEKRFSLESFSDSGVSFSNDCFQHSKHSNSKIADLAGNVDCANCENVIEKKQTEAINGSVPMKTHGDPNDLQNFAKKNLTKATTNELLKAATEKTKLCNIERERKLNDLKGREEETTSAGTWVNEPCLGRIGKMETTVLRPVNKSSATICVNSNRSDGSKCIEFSTADSAGLSSSTSVSSSGCGGSDWENSSLCGSDQDCQDCCQCNRLQYSQSPASKSSSCLADECCNTVEGVFWNNSYNELATDIAASCCCSLSSCDDDNCSYYDGNFSVAIQAVPVQRKSQLEHSGKTEELIQHKKLLAKTDDSSELRPLSNDSINEFSALNSILHTGDQIQNQQDAEARRLKRGHVLTELLETERIYVNEMSAILTGYCDRLKSEEFMHLAPVSLHGKEDVLFGNLHDLHTFHNDVFLKDLENCISTTELVALCFVQRRDTFYRLYSFYCQNIPRSERLRESLVDTHVPPFLQECQKRLGHKLPLAAYLLKPVQRITKYQLLLKDLLRFSDSGSYTKELQKALDCMLIVLKCVNDSMHQVAITGFPTDLAELGELLMQDSFQVWTESKKDIRLRIKPQQRHIFLYQKSMLFCKQSSKPGHNKSTYQFKHHVQMSEIGLTESVRGDSKRFEVWLKGRQEVHTLQTPSVDVKNKWVSEIKRVLLNQLEELKGEKIKLYGLNHRGLRQTTSWDTPNIILGPTNHIGFDASSESSNRSSSNCSDDSRPLGATPIYSVGSSTDKDQQENCGWSSDCSNSEDEQSL